MIATSKIEMDLNWYDKPKIEAIQDDKYSRNVEISLVTDGTPWPIPTGATAVVNYVKADGTGGEYDTMPNGETAWSASGNVLTVKLAPQVLTAPGAVHMAVTLILEHKAINTFQIVINVHKNVAAMLTASENYKHVVGFVPMPTGAVVGQYIKVTEVDADGKVRATQTVDIDTIIKTLRDTLAEKGDNIYKDPATGLVYLRSGTTKLGDGIKVGSGTGGTAFDTGYIDEEGYLHLTLDGVDIEGFDPFFVGSGGGSGGDYGSMLKVTCSLESRIFSIMSDEPTCILPFVWSSTDTEDGSNTGPGTASWSVNGSRVATYKIEQGYNEFDVRKYLTEGEDSTVILTVSDAYGNSKNLPFTIGVASFGLTWNLDEMAYHKDEAVTIRLAPTGTGDKTVKVEVDGEVEYTEVVTSTGRTISTTIGPLSHGAHTIRAWLEADAAGETVTTDALHHVGIWTVSGATAKIVAVLEPELTVPQYGTAAVKFMAVDPANETTSVELRANGTTVSILTDVGRTVNTWAYKAKAVGTETLAVVCGTVADTVTLTVTDLGYAIAPITSGLVLDIDPSGHSNSEAGRANFGYTDKSGVNHPFTFSDNFDWTGGGFQLDEDGVTAFVVKRGTYVTADCSLFSDNAKTNGKEIKLIFKATNVRNYDAELINCMSGNVGIKVQAQEATVGSEAETINVRYCEGKKIEMDVNIQASNENSLAYVCMKAVPSAKPVKYGSTDSWTQTAAKLLTIGSEDADVWIYRVKMYGNSLNRYEILDNYIADCTDPEEMVARYLRNDIFDTEGKISISKLTARNTELRSVHIKAKRMTTGKDDEVTADIEIIYVAGGETHHLIATGITFKAQGTSSLEYILAALNLDIDFSTATRFTNGKGDAITSYAFTPSSIPVDYFNLKADVASSESANNVVLCDEFNSYNPVPFAGKTGGVRDTIEGHPCAVFFTNTSDDTVSIGARSVAAGETVLYFAGNMNNSKKNFAVFGWDSTKWPEQCCVEVLNNISLQCRFRSDDLTTETWDGAEGTSNFEFAYPKNPTDAMKAKFQELLTWVVSTAPDRATGEPLTPSVIIGGAVYANDTTAYRNAKWLAEYDDYFIHDQPLFHALKTERHCMTDNRSKNTFLCYDYYPEVGGYRWSFRRQYDGDTGEGNDNSGGATFSYGLELNDIVGDSYVFNANDNTIWVNIFGLMHDELKRVYKENKDAWDAARIIKKFNDYQAITPEALRIEDMWNKYFEPLLLANESAFLKRCHGTKEYWREQFETYQDVYFASKYCDTSDRANCISLRATVSNAAAGNIDITPYSDLYITVMYGTNGTVRIRAKRNVTYTVECPVDSLTDTETYIFAASNLTKLGDLSKLKTKFVTLTKAEKLQVLPIGCDEAGYENLNMTELSLGNNTLIEYLDVRGLPNLTGAMNLSNLTSLEEFYGNGSGMTSLTFAKGAPLRIARVPAVTAFAARDLEKLETFVMDGSNLLSLWVENCPKIDTLALCKAATSLARGRLIGVTWNDDNADVLTRLARLQTSGGMDAQGETIDGFVLTGRAYCAVITQAEIDTITAAFPDLALSYGEIVTSYTVTFKNWDGTTFAEATQTVRYGGTALNPVTAGMISKPTREPTVGETFAFTGWDKPLTNIVMDTVITAVFAASVRYYTVRFWYDEAESSLLQTSQVAAYGSCVWEGSDLTRSDGAVWMGWDNITSNVQSDLDVHALFVTPVLPDSVPTEYDYLYSNDPDDSSAYTAAEFYGILYYGRERDFFAKGDKIRLVCSTSNFADTEIIMVLRSFKHFMSAERVGQFAGPYFGMIGLMNATRQMNNVNTNVGGFPAMTMPTFLNETVLPGLPQFFRTMIEKITVLSSAGNTTADIVSMDTYLTLESQAEMGFNASDVPYKNEVAEGADEVTFSCYTDNASRIKKTYNGTGSAGHYWLRSPLSSSTTHFCFVYNGGIAFSIDATNSYGVAFGFCLRSNIAQ